MAQRLDGSPLTPGQLAQALEAVVAERDTLQAALVDLAQPSARLFVIAVDHWCDVAQNVKHPRHLQARQLLGALVQVLDRAPARRADPSTELLGALVQVLDRARATHASLSLPGGPAGKSG